MNGVNSMNGVHYDSTDIWDEAMWRDAWPVYDRAFPAEGRKSETIIRRMFERGMCRLHLLREEGAAVAMALTGFDEQGRVLLIDYLAVDLPIRGRGYGRRLLELIRDRTVAERSCRGILVEVEAAPTPENWRRIRFWERCGFRLTDYVHRYIWVPERYRAMALDLDPESPLPTDGRELFRFITRFHERAYRGR